MKFHHIGICCKNIKKEIERIEKIHTIEKISDIVYDNNQNAELCMLELKEGIKMELISGEVVKNLIKKRISYYHLCYEVKDIEKEKSFFIKNGAILLKDLEEAILFENKKVCFLMASYGLVELKEV